MILLDKLCQNELTLNIVNYQEFKEKEMMHECHSH